jgi:type II secretory pathway pseudopilin PulG
MFTLLNNLLYKQPPRDRVQTNAGFTIVEVVVAAVIMMILCIGVFSVYSYATNSNTRENLRAQALSVLQAEVEYYRSLKFIPVGSSTELSAGTYNNVRTRTAADGRVFNISVTITNKSYNPSTSTTEANCTFKEIFIKAVPETVGTAGLANLRTELTIQRVRAN